MSAVVDRIRREPALVVGFVAAMIALGTAFGLELTNEQTGAISAFVVAVLAFVTRSQVTPVYDARHGDLARHTTPTTPEG